MGSGTSREATDQQTKIDQTHSPTPLIATNSSPLDDNQMPSPSDSQQSIQIISPTQQHINLSPFPDSKTTVAPSLPSSTPSSLFASPPPPSNESQRYGSMILNRQNSPSTTLQEYSSFGFTGETYYHYDRGLDLDHPILILHFNDVYNIEPGPDGQGGISRFATAIKQYSDQNPLILFSGDAFNPSYISTYTKGRHMVPFMNMLKIHSACVGNHDLDFGVDHLEYLAGSTQFPWLLSNVFDAFAPDRPLAGASLYRLFEWQGHRVGVIGLVEHEWLTTLAQVNEEDIVYHDYVEAANRLAKVLRAKDCDLIIALTHMRAPNDERLAREALDIDIVLGGHDHEYYGTKRIGNTIVAKSGSDFREFTTLTIYPGVKTSPRLPNPPVDYTKQPIGVLVPGDRGGGALQMPRFKNGSVIEWECITVTSQNFPSNKHIDVLVSKYIAELDRHVEKVLGQNRVVLETRFAIIRTQETNVGNWLTDLMRANTRSHVAFVNSGTVRSDCLFQPGDLKLRDLVTMLPMPDALVVVECDGKTLRDALENSVSQFPKTEGRFLQISGARFSFDPLKPPQSRVISIDLEKKTDGGFTYEPLKDTDVFKLCTKEYLKDGKDGFDSLKKLKVLVPSDEVPMLPTMVTNSFSLAAMASGLRKPRNKSTLRRVDTFKAMTEDEQQHWCGMTMEDGTCKLNCVLDGRIINIRA